VSLPEPACAVCACPGRSYVLGISGAVYSARWHGAGASRGPSVSPWTCWSPPSPSQRVCEISSLSAHVLLRTAAGSALSFGEPHEGKLGYDARTVYVTTPRLIEALKEHTIVGVAAGARHSLFLTEDGACFAAGVGAAGQCGLSDDERAAAQRDGRRWRRMVLPAACAPLVAVAAGHAHSLLLDHTGRIYACGLNKQGQCGIQTDLVHGDECVHEPTLVSSLLPHTVCAMEAGPYVSVFEVHEVHGSEPAASTGAACGRCCARGGSAFAVARGQRGVLQHPGDGHAGGRAALPAVVLSVAERVPRGGVRCL
jgi:alpha-tubulin suppressor-like RCC1 family protein